MAPKEFWDDDPALLWSYYLKYDQDQANLINENEFNAWRSGKYVEIAVTSVMSQMFAPKGTKAKSSFPEQPVKVELKRVNPSKSEKEIKAEIEAAKAAELKQKQAAMMSALGAFNMPSRR